MFRLDLRTRRVPARRDASIDWNSVIAKAQTAVQRGQDLEAAFNQLQQAVTSFVEQTKAQSQQLLSQIDSVRSAATAQAEVFNDIETDMYGEDDVPAELDELYNEMNTGDYDGELDELAEQLENIVG